MDPDPKPDRPVLVVGASGQLGARVVRRLVAAGRPVRALVRPTSRQGHLRQTGVQVVHGDLTDPASLDAACQGAGPVIANANAVWARDYITAARAAGKGPLAITVDHVLPNIASQLIVQATISFATAILAEAALSYLGLGTQPPQPSWGRMLNEAQTLMFQAPMLAVYPGVAIVLSVLGLNLMGDGLRDLMDPKLARRR